MKLLLENIIRLGLLYEIINVYRVMHTRVTKRM